ncbi:hypothetical protein ABIF97_002782 [Bradyrhizobium japonicum]
MRYLVLWACAAAGLGCDTIAPPDASALQAAYQREASSGSTLHSDNLRIVDATCNPAKDDRFLCQITFLSTDDATQRLYFDVVAAAWNGERWELKSGLCRR